MAGPDPDLEPCDDPAGHAWSDTDLFYHDDPRDS